MPSFTYTIVMERNEDGGYTITVPALKGCVTQSHTLSEGLERAREAIEAYVESLALLGKHIPADRKVVRIESENLSEALIFKITAKPDLSAVKPGEKVG